MDFRFFKALPEANVQWPAFPPDQDPPFTLIALERTNDPDANNHTGFDYFGAYGEGGVIAEWAASQPAEEVAKEELPSPITFYPAPFNEA
jgi:hypothetical protein